MAVADPGGEMPHRLAVAAWWFASGLLGSLVSAQVEAPDTAEPANAAPDRIALLDGRSLVGRLEGIREDAVAFREDGSDAATRIELDGVRRLAFGGRESATVETAPDTLWLRSGGSLPAALQVGKGARGEFAVPFSKVPLSVAWRHVAAVRFGAVDADFERSRTSIQGTKDHVFALVGSGDKARIRRVSLRVTGIDQEGVQTVESSRPLPLARVRGIVFAPERGVAPDPLANPVVSARLTNGRELVGKLVEWTPMQTRLRLAEGAEMAVPTELVTALVVSSDRLVMLQDLPRKAEQVAAFDTVWPIYEDQGPAGGPIEVGDYSFERGLVLVPKTRLVFETGGRFDTFEATIGMAQGHGPLANAVLRVLADGKVVFDSGAITGRTRPREVSVEIARAQSLTLEVDFGDHFDLGDLVAIAYPRVLAR